MFVSKYIKAARLWVNDVQTIVQFVHGVSIIGDLCNNVFNNDRDQLKKTNLYLDNMVSQLKIENMKQEYIIEESQAIMSSKNHEIEKLREDNRSLFDKRNLIEESKIKSENLVKEYQKQVEIYKGDNMVLQSENDQNKKMVKKLNKKKSRLENELSEEQIRNKLHLEKLCEKNNEIEELRRKNKELEEDASSGIHCCSRKKG